jgi:nitrogen fixation protein NifU and related proteins
MTGRSCLARGRLPAPVGRGLGENQRPNLSPLPLSTHEDSGRKGIEVSMPDWSFISRIPWMPMFVGAAVIFLLVAAWIWIEHQVDPYRGSMDHPDATAFVRGKCGDAMKISLRFSEDRVVDAKYWTDGCRMSRACGAAARLALKKTAEEIADIDHKAIEKEVDVLPEEDLHCATLAAGALQEALRAYVIRPETISPSREGENHTEEFAYRGTDG